MRRLIIDTDPGIDDGMAILLALEAGRELKVEGLTTVSGNVGIEDVTRNACAILELCGREDIPVYRGASGPIDRVDRRSEDFHGGDGLGGASLPAPVKAPEEEDAVDYLLRMADENPGELTLVPIGPLTNIAAAVRRDPGFAGKIREVAIMGGAEAGGNMSPVAEFNFWYDPEAAKTVFGAGFNRIVMVGLDATRRVVMTPAVRELLYQIDTPVSRFLHESTRAYVDSYWKLERKLTCEMCDPLVIGYLIDPSILSLKKSYVDIETRGLCDGMSVVYESGQFTENAPNCEVAKDADSKRFFGIFLKYLFPEHSEDIQRVIDWEFR